MGLNVGSLILDSLLNVYRYVWIEFRKELFIPYSSRKKALIRYLVENRQHQRIKVRAITQEEKELRYNFAPAVTSVFSFG